MPRRIRAIPRSSPSTKTCINTPSSRSKKRAQPRVSRREMRRLGFKVTERGRRHRTRRAVRERRRSARSWSAPSSTHYRWKKRPACPMPSLTKTAMHACGHDIHMATWVGSARALVALRRSVARPAHVRGTARGRRASRRQGDARRRSARRRFPEPDFGFALHVSPAVAGSVSISQTRYQHVRLGRHRDPVQGAWRVTDRCRGATIDPIVIASRFVTDVQSIISQRERRTASSASSPSARSRRGRWRTSSPIARS